YQSRSYGRIPRANAPGYGSGGRGMGGYGPPGSSTAAGWTSARMPAAHPDRHHLRFAVFHDGNPGHLWRGELGAMLGEAVIVTGIIMWLAQLTYSPKDVAFALIAMGAPALLAGPVGATLTRVEEPAGLFKLVGRLRVVFALALIGMHYLTVLPVVYLLLFGISLCGRLRGALRVAATRACLAPGEPEKVAAAIHFSAVVVAVVGPLLATLLYIVNGERILLVAAGAATIFLLGTSADSLVDALPYERRAFLWAQPDPDAEDDREDDDDPYDDADMNDPEIAMERREAALPEWEQWGPGTISEAVADVSAGLRLIGSNGISTTAIRALSTLALVGGGFSVMEVFYVTDRLLRPTFYLGPMIAAEGAGLALGATLWSDLGRRGSGKGSLLFGMLGTGAALVGLAAVNVLPVVFFVAMGLGAANALAVEGAREALRARFDGVERRAIAAAETMIVGLCGIAGALGYVAVLHGYTLSLSIRRGAGGQSGTPLGPLSVTQLLLLSGVGLLVAGVISIFLMGVGSVTGRKPRKKRKGRRGRAERETAEMDEDEDDLDASRSYTAQRGRWEDDGEEAWDDESDDYEDSRYARSYGAESQVGWEDQDEPEDDNWAPPGRGGRPGQGSPRGGRGGWR
ncbi:MAG TPA: hypothetical protein VF818_02185, partial [Ktedonobacterales bacterium]